MRRSPRPLFAVAAVAALALAATSCGGSDDDAAESTTTAAAATSTTVAEGDLPGERIDLYPYEGAALAVVGVAADDVLNLRSGPGASFDQLLTLAPLADAFEATGHNRQVDDELWVEVVVDGKAGWVNGSFVSQVGATTDLSGELTPVPRGTLTELAQAVAAQRASTEPPSTVVVVDGPTEGDPGEITVDVLGLGDDAQRGERLRVVAASDGGAGGGYSATSVEATALCARGVTEDGLCV